MTNYDDLKGAILADVDSVYETGVTDGKAAQQASDAPAIAALNATISGLQADEVVDEQTIAQLQAQVAELQAELDDQNPPPPPPPPTGRALTGVSLDVGLPDTSQTPDAVRFYTSTLNTKAKTALAKSHCMVLSTKDTTPGTIVATVKANPDDDFWVTTHHEPDDDITKTHSMTVAQYVTMLNALGNALKGLPNVKFGPIHNGWMGHVTWLADEHGADTSLWSFFGLDRYADNYETPEAILAEGRDYAKSLGLPLVVGECSAPPTNPASQQKFAAQLRSWTLDPANNADVVCWWVGTGYAFANANVQHAFLGS